jgi:UDP-glucose 4-epimerase
MKILVTGGAGFIGSNLVKRLLNEGHEVQSLDNYSTGTVENEVEGCKYWHGDISTIDSIDKDYDLIFHLAAQSRVQPSFKNPTETFRINVKGTEDVCIFAHHIGAKVIYAGSSSKHHNPSTSPYAMYKYLGEGVCNLYKESFGVNIEVCRFYNVYGPGEALDEKNGNVIGIWRSIVNRQGDLQIVGDGEQRRDFTHVDDIVDGLWRIGMANFRSGECDFQTPSSIEAWELGAGINYSINELAKMFQDKFNVGITYIEDQPGNYRKTLCTDTLAQYILGWEPQDRLLYYINNL